LFQSADWTSDIKLRTGLEVEFEANGEAATDLRVVKGGGLDAIASGLADVGATAATATLSAASMAATAATDTLGKLRARAANGNTHESAMSGSDHRGAVPAKGFSILALIGRSFERLLGFFAWLYLAGAVIGGIATMMMLGGLMGFLGGLAVMAVGVLLVVLLFGFISIFVAMRQHMGEIEMLLRSGRLLGN
jgi:hypothetical protein